MQNSIKILSDLLTYKKFIEGSLTSIQAKYDLCKIDAQILYYLGAAGGDITVKDILETSLFTKGHISQSVSRLRGRGFIKTKKDSEDKRQIHLILLPASNSVISEIESAVNKSVETVFSSFSKDDYAKFNGYIQQIRQNISNCETKEEK